MLIERISRMAAVLETPIVGKIGSSKDGVRDNGKVRDTSFQREMVYKSLESCARIAAVLLVACTSKRMVKGSCRHRSSHLSNFLIKLKNRE